MRRRVASTLAVACVLLMIAPAASAGSAVNMYDVVSLSDEDLGLNGAALDPVGEWAIVFGADAYLELVSTTDPETRIELLGSSEVDLNDGDFHPGGQTAFIVGNEGQVLRYARADHSITNAGGQVEFGQTKLTAVAWNTGGSWAYVGGEDGWLWRMRAAEDGGAEVHPILGRGGSDISGIDCHPSLMLCVVSSTLDGIGVIDRDHSLHWIGGTYYPWSDVQCPTGDRDECVAVSSDRNIATISLNGEQPSTSEVEIVQLSGAEGHFTGLSHQHGDRSLIIVTPFGLIEHDLSLSASFPWLEYHDAVDFNASIAGERIVSSWSTDRDSGWILTDRGTLVQYHPPLTNSVGGILGAWILIAIPLATLLVLLSLMFGLFPGLRQWFTLRFGSAEEKRDARRATRRKKGG